MRQKIKVTLSLMFLSVLTSVSAMHITEGFLPIKWAAFWSIVMLPIFFYGLKKVDKVLKEDSKNKLLIGVIAAFAFTLSSLKMPSVMGSSSHPTGVGLGAILFGPGVMVIVGIAVLIFQTLLLAHGGITTLGANSFSMAFAGPLVSYWIYKGLKKIRCPESVRVFMAATLGNWATYVVTSLQLALAYPDQSLGIMGSFTKFLGVFAVSQVPIAIVEGMLTIVIFNYIAQAKRSGGGLNET
ncbi:MULTISPECIES: energy-coupling factor ABC transporter permease [unclassified Fusibacter]|uniref:energy-coupling factor ABC transporter permease n=1 Tax=unclassified Fusibacter TaxID=2624464 RepID=UPI00101107CC|nr:MULTISPECIES: energy-coupling factor ABC transporter permease [unclassified Fusibacter]MCK8060514.1 energy-coupling factor ABC transporter permease [Fusibacter sp. A2]NPE20197.1 energy-coupling factor ABC transporter permease [Fusibacter sp. A1]RXV63407.1 energy-coupling factor ABC transporter permease [Fusibacter sp. A1]